MIKVLSKVSIHELVSNQIMLLYDWGENLDFIARKEKLPSFYLGTVLIS